MAPHPSTTGKPIAATSTTTSRHDNSCKRAKRPAAQPGGAPRASPPSAPHQRQGLRRSKLKITTSNERRQTSSNFGQSPPDTFRRSPRIDHDTSSICYEANSWPPIANSARRISPAAAGPHAQLEAHHDTTGPFPCAPRARPQLGKQSEWFIKRLRIRQGCIVPAAAGTPLFLHGVSLCPRRR